MFKNVTVTITTFSNLAFIQHPIDPNNSKEETVRESRVYLLDLIRACGRGSSFQRFLALLLLLHHLSKTEMEKPLVIRYSLTF